MPVLFNLYMSKIPSPPLNIKLTYADDSSAFSSGPKFGPLCDNLNSYLATLEQWFKARNLFISPSKSSAMVFTTFTNEVKTVLSIFINGDQEPTKQDPKVLGVTFDPLLTFKHHVSNTKSKVMTRTNVLKALTGSSWGKDKETLLSTYNVIRKPILDVC